jgi:hypothetical protein
MERYDRSSVLRDLRDHVALVGARRWGTVRAKHPAISESTFWRLVRSARRDMFGDTDCPGQRTVEAHAETTYMVGDRTEDLCRSQMAKKLDQPLDLPMGALNVLFNDAMLLRSRALHADGTVRNAALLDRSIRLRYFLVSRRVKLQSRIIDNARGGAFFSAVIATVAQEAPEAAHRIIDSLRRLSASIA